MHDSENQWKGSASQLGETIPRSMTCGMFKQELAGDRGGREDHKNAKEKHPDGWGGRA